MVEDTNMEGNQRKHWKESSEKECLGSTSCMVWLIDYRYMDQREKITLESKQKFEQLDSKMYLVGEFVKQYYVTCLEIVSMLYGRLRLYQLI